MRNLPRQRIKHTHIVQREYLKNFSIEEDGKYFIWRFDKTTGEIKKLTIDKVAVENYFYPQEVEDWLKKEVEDKGISIIEKIINQKTVKKLDQEEKLNMARWLIVQDLRTREYFNVIKQGLKETAEAILKKDFIPYEFPDEEPEKISIEIEEDQIKAIQISMMRRFERYSPIISESLHWNLVENNTGISFYTSDHPVIKDNTYLNSFRKLTNQKVFGSGKGYFSKGVELHLTLNPEIRLIIMNLEPLYDMLREMWKTIKENPQLYRIVWPLFPHDKYKQLKGDKMQANKDTVLYINEHIVAFSNRFVFSKDNNFSIAKNFLERIPEYKDEERKRWDIK